MSDSKKQALYWLGGLLLMLAIAYSFAFKKTFQQYRSNAKNASQIEGYVSFQKNKSISTTVLIPVKEGSVQQNILSTINKLCLKHNVRLQEMKRPFTYDYKDFKISTYPVFIRGDFYGLMKWMYDMETEITDGTIKSFAFKSGVDRKRKKKYLELTIYIQSIKPKEFES